MKPRKLPGHALKAGHNPADDEMRYTRTRPDGGVFEVRISRTARLLAKPSVDQRITDWFDHHRLPEAGTSIRIPEYHFDPRYHG